MRLPTRERFREVLDNAVLAEELGFDGFRVGERHERPFISSSPTVVLSHVAALTKRIRLFTAATTLSLLDSVRAYEDKVFRKIWRQDKVTARTRFRPEATDAEVWPRPYQQPVRVWHGSATSKESVDLAARHGDPLFSANVTNPIEPYAELIRHYRERWEYYGHDPADAGLPVVFETLKDFVERSSALSAPGPVCAEPDLGPVPADH